MCFSAAASFSVAGATAMVGIFTLSRVRSPQEILLASFPLLFAFQQFVEGALWLLLPGARAALWIHMLAMTFVFLADVVWPSLAPTAVYLIEPKKRRRQILLVSCLSGAVTSMTSAGILMMSPYDATIVGKSIQYVNSCSLGSWVRLPYLAATVLPLLLSSHKSVQALGGLILVGFAVSAYLYVETFLSVWCFFAAAASLVLLFQFVRGFQTSSP